MKMMNKILSFAAFSPLLLLCSCEEQYISTSRGDLPDKDVIENTYGTLRSNRSTNNNVRLLLMEGNGFVTDNLYYQFTKPVPQLSMELTPVVDNTSDVTPTLLPSENYDFPDGNTLSATANSKKTDLKRIRFFAKGLTPGEYILPITTSNDIYEGKSQIINYRISVKDRFTAKDEHVQMDDPLFIGYLNTSIYDPRLANDYQIWKTSVETGDMIYAYVGSIINLRVAQITYDVVSNRAKLALHTDLRHVLEGAATYIRPLQDNGKKVCLCIEGGGRGLGFCNMTDNQIDDFAAQVKACVEMYGLDGVNLWDRNSSYEKADENGLPPMNTTSYPKLIQKMKAALGDKLLTLVDYGEPTEYFHDTGATGGIKAGEHIDYAWSGYSSMEFPVQLHDPWHPDFTSQYNSVCTPEEIHQPIAGLEKSKYGCISCVFSSPKFANENYTGYDFVWDWKLKHKDGRGIIVINDIRDNLQDELEGAWAGLIPEIYKAFAADGQIKAGNRGSTHTYNFLPDLQNDDPYSNGYGKWLKDW